MKELRALGTLVVTLVGIGTTSAAPAPDPLALLRDPHQLAGWLRAHSLQVAAAGSRVRAAEATRDQAHVLPNPQLSTQLGGIALGKTVPVVDPMTMRGLGFDQTSNVTIGISELFELGKRGPRAHAASLRLDETKQRELATIGASIGDATLSIGRVAYLTQRRDAIAANLASARQLEALEHVRVDKQDLAEADFMHLQLESSEIAAQLQRAESELASATAACASAIYAPCAVASDDADVLATVALLPASLPHAETAVAARPAQAADRLESAALQSDADLAAARKVPDPTISLAYTYDNLSIAGDQPQTLVAGISIPLPLFDRGTHEAAAARANASATLQDEHAAEHAAVGAIAGLVAQRSSLEQSLHRLATEDVPRSKLLVDQTRRAFDLGQARLADLLLAQRSQRELGLEALDLEFDLFAIRVQLRQLLGLDDEAARTSGALS